MPLLQIPPMPVNRGESGIVSRMGESGYCTQLLRLFCARGAQEFASRHT